VVAARAASPPLLDGFRGQSDFAADSDQAPGLFEVVPERLLCVLAGDQHPRMLVVDLAAVVQVHGCPACRGVGHALGLAYVLLLLVSLVLGAIGGLLSPWLQGIAAA
jgi:hypothetical protein